MAFLGEFLGELALNLFFILTAYGFFKAGSTRSGYVGVAVGIVGLITAFRNVTAAVGPIAEVNNYILPLWLIAMGVILIRWRLVAT